MEPLSAAAELDRRILDAVRAIPRGGLASYGGLACQLGMPRGARRVARALAGNDDPALPWHRVLRAGGRIAFAPGSAAFEEQRRRLLAEGHQLRAGRVLGAFGKADLDALLWRPGGA